MTSKGFDKTSKQRKVGNMLKQHDRIPSHQGSHIKGRRSGFVACLEQTPFRRGYGPVEHSRHGEPEKCDKQISQQLAFERLAVLRTVSVLHC